jgi:RimJ/RimL family protein N-acetyltransferase
MPRETAGIGRDNVGPVPQCSDVRLRPFESDDLPVLRRMVQDPEVLGPDWPGYVDVGELRRRLTEDGLLAQERGMLAVEHGSEIVGEVSWRAVRYGGAPHALNLGVAILPEVRGRGLGVTAQQLLVDYLFDHTTVERLEAVVRVDNPAECRSLERVGFTREGVLRSAQFKQGAWRDVAVYSRLRSDAPRPSRHGRSEFPAAQHDQRDAAQERHHDQARADLDERTRVEHQHVNKPGTPADQRLHDQ